MEFVFLTQQSVSFLLLFLYRSITGKHLCWSLIIVKLQVWFVATLLKRDSNTDVFLRNLLIFKNVFFTEHLQWFLLFIMLTHALWIKLICRDAGTVMFLWILRNCQKHYWPPPVSASSQHAKHQNTLWQLHAMGSMLDGKYSLWCNRFLPITKAYLEPSRKSTMKLFCKNS